MSVSDFLDFANYGAVLFFGIVLSLYLADLPFGDHKKEYALTLAGFFAAQALFYILTDSTTLYRSYPFLIHIPLILILRFCFHKNIYISAIAVLSAYLMCTPRKWIGTLVSSFFGYDSMISSITTIVVTIPLLYLIIRYISPYVVKLKYESSSILWLFLILPLVYYVLEYTFTVYTNLLYTGGAVIVDFFDSFIVLLYFILSSLILELSNQRNRAEGENMLLSVTASQAQKEIAQLYRSQQQTAVYRHDLRHHMNFLQNCITEKRYDEALSYMDGICEDLESHRIIRYCADETLNLIFSSYAEKAKSENITTVISVSAYDFSRFQNADLCSLFANAIENAIKACAEVPDPADRSIDLRVYEKNSRLCINMSNTCSGLPEFQNGIPVTHEKGHGIGVKSMISIVDKYGGVYGFSAGDGEFRFQASM